MTEIRTEGIVLKTIPFKDSHRIINIFTHKKGLISLFIKNLSKNKPALVNLTTPLCRSEFIFQKGRTDLYRFIDGTIIDMHLELRQSYKHLKIAGKMLNALSTSQMPEKASPRLFGLFANYLKHLSIFPNIDPLWASFQLKLLKHEGLLALSEKCNICTKQASSILDGESLCITCAKTYGFRFITEDWKILLGLFHTQNFEYLKVLPIHSTLMKSIEILYQSLIRV